LQPSSADDRPWSRRDLLIRGGQTVAVAGLMAGTAWYLYDPHGDAGLQQPEPIRLKDYFAPLDFSASAKRLSIARGQAESVDQEDAVLRMVKAALGGLDDKGMARFIARGDVVVLKPNVGFARSPQVGATTNPLVVRAVARLCFQAGARQVIVADNPIENPAACFAKSGIGQAARTAGASVAIHSAGADRPVQVRPGAPDPGKNQALGTWPIFYAPLADADKVIGIPVIKDHNLCTASMGMKNWYGLLGGRRNQFHQAIHDIISDLGLMMKPTLTIVDATRVMMRNGPTGGRLDDVRIGGLLGRPVILASVDPLASDSWCLQKLLGRDPAALRYLGLAWDKFGQDPDRLVAQSWREYERQGKIAETML
jgi:uncharacterized protein (DUF362 family)